MSTRGLLAFRFKGQDYVTYNHSDSYPAGLGIRVVLFAQGHLKGAEAIQAFGNKIAALDWVTRPWGRRSDCPQGGELLAAIAEDRITRVVQDSHLFRTGLDCEFAYILDLDSEILEFWDLPEKREFFPLASINICMVDTMECERRH